MNLSPRPLAAVATLIAKLDPDLSPLLTMRPLTYEGHIVGTYWKPDASTAIYLACWCACGQRRH